MTLLSEALAEANKYKAEASRYQDEIARYQQDLSNANNKVQELQAELERKKGPASSSRKADASPPPKNQSGVQREAMSSGVKFIMESWQVKLWRGQGFAELFADVDTDGSGDLSLDELEESVAEMDIEVDAEDVRQLFRLLDCNGDGQVSRQDFEEAIGGQLLEQHLRSWLRSLCLDSLVAQRLPLPPAARDGHRLADACAVLATMPPDEISTALAGIQDEIAEAIVEGAEKLKISAEGWVKGHADNNKFALDSSNMVLSFGDVSDFRAGLDEFLGLPEDNILEAMRAEHNDPEPFLASNYGTSTDAATEFEFVVAPVPGKQYPNESAQGGDGAQGRVRTSMEELLQAHATREARLTLEELIALRLYTGPMYEQYNSVMRRRPENPPYRNTMLMLMSGIVKLSQVTAITPDRKTYRGLTGMSLPENFLRRDAFGFRGGVEWGFMSTSSARDLAVQYSTASTATLPILFECDVGQVDRGADLKFLSQYPRESEILFPPMSNLEVIGEPRVENLRGLAVMVIGVRVSVNLKIQRREELEGRRKALFLATLRNSVQEANREVERLTRTQHTNNRLLKASHWVSFVKKVVSRDCEGVLRSFEAREPRWFLHDRRYHNCVAQAAGLKQLALTKLRVLYESDSMPLEDWSVRAMDVLLRTRVSELRAKYRAAARGPPEQRRETAIELAVLLGLVEEANLEMHLDMDEHTALMLAASEGLPSKTRLLLDAGCSPSTKNRLGRNSVMIAAVNGSEECLRQLCTSVAAVDARDLEHNTAIILAAAEGHSDCVRALHALGAQVDARNSFARTALMMAAKGGHQDTLRTLQELGADVHAFDKDGETALGLAALNGHTVCLQLLHASNADPNAKRRNGLTALMMAAEGGHLETVGLLCRLGASVNAATKDGLTALMKASLGGHVQCVRALHALNADVNAARKFGETALMLAAREGHVGCVEALEELGGDVNATTQDGETALMCASAAGHAAAVEVLHRCNADVNAVTKAGRAAIMEAALGGHTACIRTLHRLGAHANAADKDGRTAMMFAANLGFMECVRDLLAGNADVNSSDLLGRTALTMAARACNLELVRFLAASNADVNAAIHDGFNALMMAASVGNADGLRTLLSLGGDKDAASVDGRTAFMMAARGGNVECAKLLCDANANIDAVTQEGVSALMMVAQQRNLDSLRLLLTLNCNPSLAAVDGRTALMLAARGGFTECVRALAQGGGEVEAATHEGKTALMYAAQEGQCECLQLLRSLGADARARSKEGVTVFMLACGSRHISAVHAIWDWGVTDVNAVTDDGRSALTLAARGGHSGVLEALLSYGADVHAATQDGHTALMSAAAGGHLDALSLLHEASADVNAHTADGLTALLLAAQAGHPPCIRALHAFGANHEAATEFGVTAVMMASIGGHEEAVEALLALKADPRATTNDGWTAANLAANQRCRVLLRKAITDSSPPPNTPAGAPPLPFARMQSSPVLRNPPPHAPQAVQRGASFSEKHNPFDSLSRGDGP